MNPIIPLFAWLNGPEIIVILAVVLILFGAKKLPELAKGLGQGIKEFKKSSREIQDEINQSIDIDAPPPPPRRVAPPQDKTTAREDDRAEETGRAGSNSDEKEDDRIEETVPPGSAASDEKKS